MKLFLALTLVLGAGMSRFGCGGSDPATDTDAGTVASSDAGTAPAVCTGGGDTYTFVLHTLGQANRLSASGGTCTGAECVQSPGFNLDGRTDNACEGGNIRDYDHPSNGSTGIDNQLDRLNDDIFAGILGMDIGPLIAAQIESGSLLLMIEVSNVNDLTTDDCVTINLYQGVLPSSYMLDSSNQPEAGQTFDTDQAFSIPPANGTINSGRVNLSISSLPISFVVSGSAIAVDINTVRLQFDLAATSLSNMEIGGTVVLSQILSEINNTSLASSIPAGIDLGTLLTPYADGDLVSGACTTLSAALVGAGRTAIRGASVTVTTADAGTGSDGGV